MRVCRNCKILNHDISDKSCYQIIDIKISVDNEFTVEKIKFSDIFYVCIKYVK